MDARSLPIDPGLLERFRAAGGSIRWGAPPRKTREHGRPAKSRPRLRITRIAHLHDEEARVEQVSEGTEESVVTDSGPVGALVLLLEIDRRGRPTSLAALEGDRLPEFPQGALKATWTSQTRSVGPLSLPFSDLLALARYALR